MPVDLKEVDSSNIASIGHDSETGTLYIKFKSGQTWGYADVPEIQHKQLMEAESIGKYFATAIRPFYKATKVVDEAEPEKTP